MKAMNGWDVGVQHAARCGTKRMNGMAVNVDVAARGETKRINGMAASVNVAAKAERASTTGVPRTAKSVRGARLRVRGSMRINGRRGVASASDVGSYAATA
jgi:hypothetical protein